MLEGLLAGTAALLAIGVGEAEQSRRGESDDCPAKRGPGVESAFECPRRHRVTPWSSVGRRGGASLDARGNVH